MSHNPVLNVQTVSSTFVGQENLTGQHFQSRILGQIDEDIAATLAAFGHYVYNLHDGKMAIDDLLTTTKDSFSKDA